MLYQLLHRARQDGSFQPIRKGRVSAPRSARSVDAEEQVLETMLEDPRRSVFCVAQNSPLIVSLKTEDCIITITPECWDQQTTRDERVLLVM